jgi:hypothetical protein
MGQQDAITHSAQYRHSTEKIPSWCRYITLMTYSVRSSVQKKEAFPQERPLFSFAV